MVDTFGRSRTAGQSHLCDVLMLYWLSWYSLHSQHNQRFLDSGFTIRTLSLGNNCRAEIFARVVEDRLAHFGTRQNNK